MALTENEVVELQRDLGRCGWPIRVDGDYGPKTDAAMDEFRRGVWTFRNRLGLWQKPNFSRLRSDGTYARRVLDRAARSGGHCSRHFYFRQFDSNGNGWIKVDRALVKAMEAYYRLVGGQVGYFSAYRDPAYNKAVGGVSDSQHLYGTAVDFFEEKVSVSRLKSLGVFSGIGVQGSTGLVRHADVRHAGPHNPSGGTPSNPTIWQYSY